MIQKVLVNLNGWGEDISFDKRYDNTILSKIDRYDKQYFEI